MYICFYFNLISQCNYYGAKFRWQWWGDCSQVEERLDPNNDKWSSLLANLWFFHLQSYPSPLTGIFRCSFSLSVDLNILPTDNNLGVKLFSRSDRSDGRQVIGRRGAWINSGSTHGLMHYLGVGISHPNLAPTGWGLVLLFKKPVGMVLAIKPDPSPPVYIIWLFIPL